MAWSEAIPFEHCINSMRIAPLHPSYDLRSLLERAKPATMGIYSGQQAPVKEQILVGLAFP